MTDPIDLDKHRRLKQQTTWEPRDCLVCGENHWHVIVGPDGIYGSCLTEGCKGFSESG